MTPSGAPALPADASRLLDGIERRCAAAASFDSLSVCTVNDTQEKLMVFPITGAPDRRGRLRKILSLAETPLAGSFRDRTAGAVTLDAGQSPSPARWFWDPPAASGLLIPVFLFDRPIGSVNLGRVGRSGGKAEERAAAGEAAAGCVDLISELSLYHRLALSESTSRRSYEQLIEFSRVGNLIVQEKDLERICNLFMQAVREHSVFRRGILTLLDEDLRGYKWFFFGMTDEEIEYFHSHSTNKMTRDQRARIFQEKYRVGNSYYIPASSNWDYAGVRSRRDEEQMLDWHPDDFLFIPLYGSHKRMVGIVSVDDPADGRAPTAEALSSLELFANQVAHAIEQKKLDLEVKKSTGKYKTLVETMNDGLVVMDFAERITLVNPTLCRLVGYRVEEMIGSSLHTFLTEESRTLVMSKKDERKLGIKSRYEVDLVSKEGVTIPVLMSGAPLYESNRLVGSFAVLSDLREQKKAEADFRSMHREILEANRKLQESMDALRTAQEQLVQAEKLSAIGELVSGVAHELNNPLTGVLGYAQLLATREVPERVKADLEKIYKEAVRCQKIVQNLLTFARKHKPEKRFVDLNQIVRASLELRAYQLRVDNVQVECLLDPELPRTMADEHQMQQVFINIVNNAHQAMVEPRGGGHLVITSGVEAGKIVLSFSDDGPGIPEDKIRRIFDPFFTTKEVGKGTGLGLSLSYGIIQEHGGTITARNAPGKGGAIFRIEMPIRQEEKGARIAPAQAARTTPPAGKRILVVDDEETVLQLLRDLLSTRGHRDTVPADGRAALDRILENRDGFDLVISDMKMPIMGGREFYEAVLNLSPDLARRIIFATGDTISPEAREFLAEPGRACIGKPFQLEEMERTIAAFFDAESEGHDSGAAPPPTRPGVSP